MTAALDPNNHIFPLNQVPNLPQIQQYSQQIALQRDQLQLAESVAVESGPPANWNSLNAKVYHSKDANSNSIYYLQFPLLNANKTTGGVPGLTNRKMYAYSEALKITGTRDARRDKLKKMVLEAGVAGIPRPENGNDWSSWEVELK